ncbi:DUF4893 domain-containing protein [Sphingomonas changnyeongensis]|uniref:DUF4893 domain-containing protein n=1 Tax=Sphingomonas changnyeongensis TaxID=2698679 RepID=A0A7Z2NVR0_9SPHN|nr:DUF4893 domain-containing protein [Sphingomonas changnyeongensis]QHL90356.1 DUF4893 domain-containing protein [Sphingomonas changnyeongensis]
MKRLRVALPAGMIVALPAAASAAALPAAATQNAPSLRAEMAPAAGADWRRVARPADQIRLRQWRTSFLAGLEAARIAGFAAELAGEGALLDPDAGRVDAPPPGAYRCRVVKLGARPGATRAFAAGVATPCRVTENAGRLRFQILDGVQRPAGRIYPGRGAQPPVFLGSLALGDEVRAIGYGRDGGRDLAGLVEAVGPTERGGAAGSARWRIILPAPQFESLVDVIEIVPAG